VRDLRERDAAAASQARLAAIVNSSADAILSTDAEGRIDSWNPGAERLLGHPAAWALGRHVSQLTPRDRAGEDEQILRPVLAGGPGQTVETERVHRDGHRVEVSLAVSGIRDGAGVVVGASIVAREIGARLRRARTDELTGLPSRQVFVDRLDAALARHCAGGGGAASWPSPSSTWTASTSSTMRSGATGATASCTGSRPPWPAPCPRARCSRASAATSSGPCARSRPAGATASAARSRPRCPRSSRSTT
jgi:PAS domain S-box-containing protein